MQVALFGEILPIFANFVQNIGTEKNAIDFDSKLERIFFASYILQILDTTTKGTLSVYNKKYLRFSIFKCPEGIYVNLAWLGKNIEHAR